MNSNSGPGGTLTDAWNSRGYDLDPQPILVDIEVAVSNAIRDVLGDDVVIQRCYYHFKQALWHKMQERDTYPQDAEELFSYFYSLTEQAMDRNVLLPPPFIKVPSPRQLARKAELADQLSWRTRHVCLFSVRANQKKLDGVQYT